MTADSNNKSKESHSDEGRRLCDLAIKKYDECKYNEALELLEKLKNEYNDWIISWNLHEWFGLSKLYLNRHEEAKSHLLIALDGVDPNKDGLDYLIILDKLAFSCFILGEDETAI